MKKVLVSGTFDPPTKGHLSIIERCSEIFDETVVCIFVNVEKEPMFSVEERREMILAMCKDLDGVTVDSWDEMLADYAKINGIRFVARGIRGEGDIGYEMYMARKNKEYNSELETIFFPAREGEENITSTLVRKSIKSGEDISGLVHKAVEEIIKDKYFKE